SPLGAVAGLETIRIIEEIIAISVKEKEKFMKNELQRLYEKHAIIGEVRGVGMLWGLELVNDRNTKEKAINEAEKIMYQCLEKGLSFKVSSGNVLQLSPALTISDADLKKAFHILDESITTITNHNE